MHATRFARLVILALMCCPVLSFAQMAPPPPAKSAGDALNADLNIVEHEFTSAAEAMPDDKYSFAPTSGEFKGVRTFAEQVKHVACANFAFFNQIEGKKPPEHCEKGGPNPAKSKAELIQYLKDSYAYGNRVLKTVNAGNMMQRVDGPYAGPDTRLGMTVTAVWHITDHYGQIVEYLRMNGIVPPNTVQYGLQVR